VFGQLPTHYQGSMSPIFLDNRNHARQNVSGPPIQLGFRRSVTRWPEKRCAAPPFQAPRGRSPPTNICFGLSLLDPSISIAHRLGCSAD